MSERFLHHKGKTNSWNMVESCVKHHKPPNRSKKSKYGFYFYTTLFPKVSGKYNAHHHEMICQWTGVRCSKFLIEISCTNTQGNLFYKLDLSITIRRFKHSSGNTITTIHERVSYVQCYYSLIILVYCNISLY
jgi:hypothetical protein